MLAEKVDNCSSKITAYSAGVDHVSLASGESDKPDTPLKFHYSHTCTISRNFIKRHAALCVAAFTKEKQGALPSRHTILTTHNPHDTITNSVLEGELGRGDYRVGACRVGSM